MSFNCNRIAGSYRQIKRYTFLTLLVVVSLRGHYVKILR